MPLRLAIVGASVRAAAQSALRAGFAVVAADLFADADLDGSCPITKIDDYPEALADWLSEQGVDAWMYTGALENFPALVGRLAATKPLWGVSGDALVRCRDPLVLQGVFAADGVAFPETLPREAAPAGGTGWLAKTYRHSAGAGVWPYGEHPPGAAVYAQRLVAGEPLSAVWALGAEAPLLLGVTRQIVESFGYRGSEGPVIPDRPTASALRVVGEALRSELGLRGVVGVDLVRGEDRLYVVEVNPRYTASVETLERAADASAVGSHAACFAGGAPVWPPEVVRSAAKRIVFARRGITIDASGAAWIDAERRAGRIADAPREGEAIATGRPVLTAFGAGPTLEEASHALRAVVAEVERRLYAH